MTPFLAALVASLIEDIRLLESFVTGPLGLHSDISMLRQSMPLPEAADLSREEARKRRLAYRDLSDDPSELVLQAVGHVGSSLAILETVREGSRDPISPDWLARARRVLARAEQKVAVDLRSATVSRLRGLCVTVDAEVTGGRPPSEVAQGALRGGAAAVRLRDRSGRGGQFLAAAREIRSLCEDHGALLIVADDPAVALSSDAHGLHLSQDGLPVSEARRVLTHRQMIGRSNSSLDDVARSQADGVDYLAVGAVFPSPAAEKSAQAIVGIDMVRRVKEIASQPVVAGGGIGPDNVAEAVGAGADCIGVGSSVTLSDDPEAATATLVEEIRDARA